MSAFGANGLIKQPGAVYAVAQDSFATYDKTVSGVLAGPTDYLQGSPADEYPNTVLVSIRITETGLDCDHIRVDLHYEGKDVEFTNPVTSQNISVDFTGSQEPIESNPQFCSQIGGTPDAPLHGAFFDATTLEFLSFPVVDPDEPDQLPSRFAGLKSYFVPQETFTSSTVEFEYPDSGQMEQIGRVFDPSEYGIFLPALPDGNRSWLNTGIRIQNIANVYYRTQRTGQLSGPRGNIPEVYGTL